MERIDEIKQHLESGETFVGIAKEFGTSPREIRRNLTSDEVERYALIRAQISGKKRVEARRTKKYLIEGKIGLKMKEHAKKSSFLTKEDAQKTDMWDYANDYDKVGYADLRVSEGLFGMTTQNIPFPNCQPTKRLQTISHGLMDKVKDKDAWIGVWKWVKLDKPDMPLVDVARHDVDTLNTTIGFADSKNDRLLTQGDSCFVSYSFADRFSYTIQNKAVYFTTEPMAEEVELIAGSRIEELEDEHLSSKNVVKYGGTFRLTNKTQKGELWINQGLVTTERKLDVGDKLLGLTGLKVTVTEVREQVADIVIHPKQVISKTGIKGAMVKELQSCGKCMVGMRADEVLGRDENLAKGGRISSVLYPVMKLFAPNMLNKIIRENSDFGDLLLGLHLVYDEGTIKLTPVPAEGAELGGHYLWDKHVLNNPDFFTGNVDEYDTVDFVREFGGKVHTWAAIRWEDIFIPQFVNTGYMRKNEYKLSRYHGYVSHTWDKNKDNEYQGKFPFTTNERKKKGQNRSYNEFNTVVERILFCRVKSGAFLRALPTLHPTKITLSSTLREQFGDSCIVYREPVVGKDNVYSVSIKYDDKLNPYCVRLPLDIVQAANGDFDGDAWAILPYNDSNLNISSHDLDKVVPDMTMIDIENMTVEERTNSVLIAEAIDYRKKKVEEGILTKRYGGARNRAAFGNDDPKIQAHILNLASYLEVVLKSERHGEKWKGDILGKIKELQSLIPEETVKKPQYGEWSLYRLVTTDFDQWKGLIGYIPSGFWRDLFNIPMKAEDKQMQALKSGKKIMLGVGE